MRQLKETERRCWRDGWGWRGSGEKLVSKALLLLQLGPGSAAGDLKPKLPRNLALVKHNSTKETQSKTLVHKVLPFK